MIGRSRRPKSMGKVKSLITEEYWEGYSSYDLGMQVDECPYAPDTTQHEDWVKGWESANHEDQCPF
jgi:ribosome modulation factor